MGSSAPTGGETTLKIEARGDDLKFEWWKYGTDLKDYSKYSGIDTDRLRIQQVKKSVAGYYRCLVKNEIKKNRILSEEAQIYLVFVSLELQSCCVDTVMKL